MQTGHEEPMRRTLDPTMRHLNWMTLAFRPRQLRDEDKSCGTQPAYIRVIYRRQLLLSGPADDFFYISELECLNPGLDR